MVMVNISNYFDQNNLMAPYGENAILFTCTYGILVQKYVGPNAGINQAFFVDKAIRSLLIEPNLFKVNPTEPFSHDNMTGIVCASKVLGLPWHKESYEDWSHRIHPRDLIFYAYMQGGSSKILAYPFLPILALIMLITCNPWFMKYKIRNGVKLLKTDGRILCWLRLNSANLPITKYLCTKLLQMDKDFGSWKKVFDYYYADSAHPNRNFPEGVYER